MSEYIYFSNMIKFKHLISINSMPPIVYLYIIRLTHIISSIYKTIIKNITYIFSINNNIIAFLLNNFVSVFAIFRHKRGNSTWPDDDTSSSLVVIWLLGEGDCQTVSIEVGHVTVRAKGPCDSQSKGTTWLLEQRDIVAVRAKGPCGCQSKGTLWLSELKGHCGC